MQKTVPQITGRALERSKNSEGYVTSFVIMIVALGPFALSVLKELLGLPDSEMLDVVYTAFFDFALVAIFIGNLKNPCAKFGMRFAVALFLVCVIALSYFFGTVHYGIYAHYFTLFCLRCIPAFIAGVLLNQKDLLRKSIPLFSLFMLVSTFFLLTYVASYFISGWKNYRGGLTYQTVSYIGAICFGINAAIVMSQRVLNDIPLVRQRSFMLISKALLPIQFIAVFITGGRGGAVAVLVITVITLAWSNTERTEKKIPLWITLPVFLGAGLLILALLGNSYQTGLFRFFDQGASRASTYAPTFKLISNLPLLGLGAFDYMPSLAQTSVPSIIYPHNILLELVLQWGIAAVVPLVALLVIPCATLWKAAKKDATIRLPLALFTVSLVNLMLSTTYLVYPLFWFVVGFALSVSDSSRNRYCDSESMSLN